MQGGCLKALACLSLYELLTQFRFGIISSRATLSSPFKMKQLQHIIELNKNLDNASDDILQQIANIFGVQRERLLLYHNNIHSKSAVNPQSMQRFMIIKNCLCTFIYIVNTITTFKHDYTQNKQTIKHSYYMHLNLCY